VTLPPKAGLDNHLMIDAIHDGRLKSMYVFGEELSLVDSNANYVAAALEKLDFFVMQEIFFSETCRFANVILPASPSLEKEGTFTSTERRIQRLYQAMEPLGESRPDWKILIDVANRLGANWTYKHPSEIYEEIASLTPTMAGVTYERLEGFKSLQWPVAPDGSDEPLLYTQRFNTPDGKATFFPVPWTEPSNQPDEEYDLHLNNVSGTGRFTRHPDRRLGTACLALWRSEGAGRCHRARERQRTLHADELLSRAGEPSHEQLHRQSDAYAGVQGNCCAPHRNESRGQKPVAAR
jgi:predicted molibdopterin-dependent oxidoreductase YjgC